MLRNGVTDRSCGQSIAVSSNCRRAVSCARKPPWLARLIPARPGADGALVPPAMPSASAAAPPLPHPPLPPAPSDWQPVLCQGSRRRNEHRPGLPAEMPQGACGAQYRDVKSSLTAVQERQAGWRQRSGGVRGRAGRVTAATQPREASQRMACRARYKPCRASAH